MSEARGYRKVGLPLCKQTVNLVKYDVKNSKKLVTIKSQIKKMRLKLFQNNFVIANRYVYNALF